MARSKQLTWTDVRVGIFVTAGVAIMIFMIMVVGTNNLAFSSKYTLHMFVPNVLSLNPGAFITVAGIKAGTIGDFEFIEHEGVNGVHVSLFIEKKYQIKITPRSEATIRTLGILGDKYVEVSLGSPDEEPLQDGDWIRANYPVDFEKLAPKGVETLTYLSDFLKAGRDILNRVNEGSGTISRLLNDSALAGKLALTVSHLNELTAAMNKPEGSVGKFLYRPEAHDNLVALSTNLTDLLQEIHQGKGSLGRFISDSTLYTNLSRMSARSDSVAAKVSAGEGTAGKLVSDAEVYTKFNTLLDELQAMIADMKQHPQKYFSVKVF